MGAGYLSVEPRSRLENFFQGGASDHGQGVSSSVCVMPENARTYCSAYPCSDPNAHEIVIDVNTRIQVLDEISHLAGARKHQCAAFIRSENCLIVWTDEVETVVESAEALEHRMIHYVWTGRHQESKMLADIPSSPPLTGESEKTMAGSAVNEKDLGSIEEEIGRKDGDWSPNDRRPVMLYAPLISGLAIILNCVFVSSGMRNLIKEALLDGDYTRFALMATVPFGFLLATVSPGNVVYWRRY